MSETRPFDVAIEILKGQLNLIESHGWVASDQTINAIKSAIRVLKAAEKVDKEPCINALYDVILLCKKPPSDWILNRLQAIRVLIESLPDKEEKP